MNTAAAPSGNWRWRYRAEMLTPAIAQRLKEMASMYERQAAADFLADLEYELRLPGHPVRLGLADGQHERHLRISGCARRPDTDSMAGRAADRIARAADYRARERPHVEPAGAAAAVLLDRRDPELGGADPDAARFGAVDGGGSAVDSGCVDQHQHGALPRVRGGPAAGRSAHARLRHAEPVYRVGGGGGFGAAGNPVVVAGQRNRRRAHSAAGAAVILYRGGGVFRRGDLYDSHHARVSAGRSGSVPQDEGGEARVGGERPRDFRIDRRHAADHEATGMGAVLHMAGAVLHVSIFLGGCGAQRVRRFRSA